MKKSNDPKLITEEREQHVHRKIALTQFRMHLIKDMKHWLDHSVKINKEIVNHFYNKKQQELNDDIFLKP